jgi:uncharacterized SAM-binding protein YcdF (DUF218 family)
VFFYASKIVWFFLNPTNCLVLLGAAGAVLLFTRRRRLGRTIVAFAAIGLLVIGFSPIPKLLMRPLEDRFPAFVEDTRPVDGIIVLGGAIGFGRGQVAFNEAASRMTAALDLAKRYPNARIVFTGGDGSLLGFGGRTEADAAAGFFETAGLAEERLLLERRSRNTRENAAFTRALVDPRPGERWLLVTSAFHMPRAIGCFRAAGFDTDAYPVDYRTDGDIRDAVRPFQHMTNGMELADLAAKEWIGLIVYRLAGYTDALLPAPRADQSEAGRPIR